MCASMKLKLKMRLEHKLAHYSHCHDPCIVKGIRNNGNVSPAGLATSTWQTRSTTQSHILRRVAGHVRGRCWPVVHCALHLTLSRGRSLKCDSLLRHYSEKRCGRQSSRAATLVLLFRGCVTHSPGRVTAINGTVAATRSTNGSTTNPADSHDGSCKWHTESQ